LTKLAIPFADSPILDDIQWRRMARLWRGEGVIHPSVVSSAAYNAALAVTADASGYNVKVGAGEAYLDGGYYADDTAQRTLAINAPDATNPRIDRVILRWDGPNKLADLFVLQGMPAVTPAVPALTQNRGGRWEEALAQVRVNVGVTNIAASAVTDERRISQPSWVPPRAKLTSTSTQSIPNAQPTQVAFNAVAVFNDSFTRIAGDNNTLYILRPGYYAYGAQVQWFVNAIGQRQLDIRRQGATILGDRRLAVADGSRTEHSIAGFGLFNVGDSLQLYCSQSSGGALSLDINDGHPALWAYLVKEGVS